MGLSDGASSSGKLALTANLSEQRVRLCRTQGALATRKIKENKLETQLFVENYVSEVVYA